MYYIFQIHFDPSAYLNFKEKQFFGFNKHLEKFKQIHNIFLSLCGNVGFAQDLQIKDFYVNLPPSEAFLLQLQLFPFLDKYYRYQRKNILIHLIIDSKFQEKLK